jgi:5'-nucleotidase
MAGSTGEIILRILISNDDGVFAPGIMALYLELSKIADVQVIAPDRNRSGASNSLTLLRPLRVKQDDNGFYRVDGTPTDCVHLGIKGFFDLDFDMVVSGINDGCNLGDDVLYSGTVAAAMEGRDLGLPSIAVSTVNTGVDIKHYQTAAVITSQLVLCLNKQALPAKTILNVNVPDLPLAEIKGLQVTRLGSRHSSASMVKELDPRGRPMYWIGTPGEQADASQGTDFWAIKKDCVSITPLHMDMTHYNSFEQVSNFIKGVACPL